MVFKLNYEDDGVGASTEPWDTVVLTGNVLKRTPNLDGRGVRLLRKVDVHETTVGENKKRG